jgi:carbon monoxide dehydrogenase subunit G
VVIRVEKSTGIARPTEEVFAFVADQTNAPRWQSGFVDIRRLTDGPPGLGTRYAFTRTLMGRRMAGENEYVEFEPARRVAFRTTSGPGLLASYAVEPTQAGTRLTSTIELDVSGILSIAEPLVARALKRDVDANLAKLRAILEASPTDRTADSLVAEEV